MAWFFNIISKKIILICIIILIYFQLFNLFAQDTASTKKLEINGYISNLQVITFEKLDENWIMENTFHNRLNLHYHVNNKISAVFECRNRFIYGDPLKYDSTYATNFEKDNGLLDLSVNWVYKKSFLLNTLTDRMYLSYQHHKFNITLGRQRINWGQTFVWNPNDLFNTFSYFDFDYPERPGSDAVRLEYFTGYASGLEFVAKTDSSGTITSAALYRFNKWNNDFQVLGGIFNDNDLVLGAGWSGSVKNIGLYGELSYFKGLKQDTITTSYFYLSLAANYLSTKNLQLQSEFLFASIPGGFKYSNFNELLNRPLNVKNLAFSQYSLFFLIGYPLTPLFNTSISAMWLPSISAYYFGPNLSYSLGDNLDASLALQSFTAKFPDNSEGKIAKVSYTIGFLRVKYNF